MRVHCGVPHSPPTTLHHLTMRGQCKPLMNIDVECQLSLDVLHDLKRYFHILLVFFKPVQYCREHMWNYIQSKHLSK